MDAKITKSRLGHMLSYDWIKILAICAAVVVVWILLFTTLAPRATSGQTFEIYVYPYVTLKDSFGSLSSLREDGAFSGDVLDMSTNNLLEDSKDTVLGAHFAAGQGDVMFVSSYEYDSGEKDADGNAIMTSDLLQFVNGYGGNCVWLGGENEHPMGSYPENANTQDYLTSCRNYLAKYYAEGAIEGKGDMTASQDKQAIETDFRARIDGDNRYKRESQIQAGLLEEYARIESLRTAYNNVIGYLEDGTLSVTELDLTVESEEDENGDGTVDSNDTKQVKGYFSFDLGNVPGIENMITTTRSEESTSTGKGVNMVILNTRLQEEALRFEQVTLLDHIVRESARLQAL
ncbi:MAG TPA: hypothetical protein H9727_01145 [Candidatus Borkfalkia avistercoris]|uniref:Uncharacterized protein n=1 Tax=Candidatus Borkfalkia avistercoris TaxID=2838504 RepID=A0A9D2CY26_9FIRM|nr:hypothetical protein [Candidatus Borkfalkia avistercoris]